MSQPRCSATNRHGEPCTQRAVLGQRVCHYHGAASPQAKAAAQRRMAEAQALATVEHEGVRPLGDPIRALRDLAAEALTVKEFFRARVAALQELRYQGGPFEQTRAELLLYERGLDRAQKFLLDLARLNLDERELKLEQGLVNLVVEVFLKVFQAAELGLSPAQVVTARRIASRELLSAGESQAAPTV